MGADGADLRERARRVMPGGVYGHLSTTRLPANYPQFFVRAKGAHLWDADGRRFVDLMCAYGPNLFGYGHEEIDAAFVRQLGSGDTMTGPSPLIVELAETLTGMITGADWAMFCKNGNDATTAALMTARQHTGRATIVRASGAYHGSAPWCALGTNGVGPHDQADQIQCAYNDVGSLEAAVAAAGDGLAAIFASPIKHDFAVAQELPDPAYARRARELCDDRGALLVVDNVRGGFRLSRDCSWAAIGVVPDLSSWGKGLANGHALSALVGSDKARDAAASIFVTGSFWMQAAPMAASLVALRLIRETDYLEHTIRLGDMLRAGLQEAADRHGFGFTQSGPSQMPMMLFEDDPDLRLGLAWTSAAIDRGVYFHPAHNMFLCAAMDDADIEEAVAAGDAAFGEVRRTFPLRG